MSMPKPQPQPQPQPSHKRRRTRERGKKRKRGEQQETSLGFFGSVPSLQEMQAANRQATKRFFQGSNPRSQRRSDGKKGWRRGAPTPKTVPPAPDHPLFRFATNDPLLTPAVTTHGVSEHQSPAVDKLAADGLNAAALDMFGTNEGLVFEQESHSFSSGEELSEGELGTDEEEGGDEEGDGLGDNRLPRQVRAQLEQQELTIADLREENLRLRERLDMLQQEMDELRQGNLGHPPRPELSDAALTSEAEEVASVMPAASPPAQPRSLTAAG